MQILLKCMLGLLLLCTSCIHIEAQQEEVPIEFKLPTDLTPVKYTLTIITILEDKNFSFSGDVTIEVKCITETDKIVVHAKDLTIGEQDVTVKVVKTDNQEADLKISSHGYENKNDFYGIVMAEKLVAQTVYRVLIKFKGQLDENLEGYYRASYTEKQSGKIIWIASTWFEPIGARLCFPCMDEPALKAKFQVSMGHAPNLRATNNMPLRETKPLIYENRNDWVLDVFEESELMSTYLVGFTVSENEFIEVPSEGISKKLGIWIRKELDQQVELAKKTLIGALKFYTEFFKVEYALPKLDLVAVVDQNRGGIEDYGMILLSENIITYDPKSSNVMNQYTTVQYICHEICHQWLGNYVTMKDWSDLWLNEGFAYYFEDVCVSQVFPDWQSMDQMFFRKYLNALTSDGLTSSHPIIVPIKTASDVDQIFDSITYDKGSCVVRMISLFLGEDVFREGLRNYVEKHKFGVVTTDDMWTALTEAANVHKVLPENVSVKQIMESWTIQAGYPYVDVKIDYSTGTATLTQKRYLTEELSENGNPLNQCWYVPVTYTTSKDPKFDDMIPKHWLNCNGPLSIKVDIQEGQWMLINIKVGGFFRTNYEEKNLRALQETLSKKETFNIIDILDRAQIIANIFGMSWTAHLSYSITFDIVKYMEIEDAYIPWRTTLESLHDMRNLLIRTDIFQPFQDFVKSFLEPKFLSIGDITKIPDDFMSYRYFTLLIYWACIYSVKSCHEQSIAIFQTWKQQEKPDENNPILPNLRDIVYCEGMKTGGEDVFNFMWERYTNSNVPTEKVTILTAMTCTQDKTLLQKMLDWTIDSSKLSREVGSLVYWNIVANNDIGFDLARDFLFKRFPDILKYFGSNSFTISDEIESLAEMMISTEDLKQFEEFLEANKDQLKGYELSTQGGIDRIKKNIAWENKHLQELKKLLTSSS